MVRQCAWCLWLIDSVGERVSPTPLPKLYEASHGICSVCGKRWIEQAIESDAQGYDAHARKLTARKSGVAKPDPIPETEPLPGRKRAGKTKLPETECLPAASFTDKATPSERTESITQLVLQLQQRNQRREPEPQPTPPVKAKRTRML